MFCCLSFPLLLSSFVSLLFLHLPFFAHLLCNRLKSVSLLHNSFLSFVILLHDILDDINKSSAHPLSFSFKTSLVVDDTTIPFLKSSVCKFRFREDTFLFCWSWLFLLLSAMITRLTRIKLQRMDGLDHILMKGVNGHFIFALSVSFFHCLKSMRLLTRNICFFSKQ